MSDTKKQSSLTATLAVCAAFVALGSFFLPFISIDIMGFKSSTSWIDMVDADGSMLIFMVCPLLGTVFSLLALKKRGMEIGTIITSAAGMILMFLAMTMESDLVGRMLITYAGFGFYLYEAASLAAIVLSISARKISTHAESDKYTIPTPKPEPPVGPFYVDPPVDKPDFTDKESKGELTETHSVPKPDAGFTPGGKGKTKEGKVECPHCGARHVAGTTSCKYCGTSMSGATVTKPHPVGYDHMPPVAPPVICDLPAVEHGPTGKSARKAVCPHCGARQSEEAVNCKYCGTAMK